MIVLNGASSSGKSTLARQLQAVLPDPWLTFGVDTLIEGMPAALLEGEGEGGISVEGDGEVAVGEVFRELEDAWIQGIAAMVRAGARVIVDEVFLGGGASQQRWLAALDGVRVCWVAVRCDAEVAAGRETARGDRAPGMAASQAGLVHQGVRYDLELDTTHADPAECALTVRRYLSSTGSS
ncbi:chloramphenicol phosphotransferase CPT [Kitasatospora azatica]|uniref:chloramphenicol phosphotransferase CPT n=1 Tax=Kitasatospora azatica TaxID=58347 RepID=UPI00056BD278|nr:chloramphenicol phosphotransferase CPT [Kitasatospora azatica]